MRAFDPELPWGCWLRIEPGDRGTVFVDEDGGRWTSVREAFWCGRLGMPGIDGEPPADQLELMHALLACRSRRGDPDEESQDLFRGDRLFQRSVLTWMAGHGLLTIDPGRHLLHAEVAPEGWAVMLMLDATRPVPVRQMRASGPSVRVLVELARGPVVGEERRRMVEASVEAWEVLFLRRTIGAKASIVLSHRGDGPMPLMRTVWSLAFDDERLRDTFYDWLCDRADRWPDWAKVAGAYGGPKLTQRLLTVMIVSCCDGEEGGRGARPLSLACSA